MTNGLVPGSILHHRYEIEDLIGSGGFGATYRVRDLDRFGEICVLKELLPTHTDNETARRLFEREARLLFEISHPQIPTLHAYFEEGGRFYLVQDYVGGRTVAATLEQESRLPEVVVAEILDSLLGVLEYLHGRPHPVIHRDIKPANIILGSNRLVYLIDFGAVREAMGIEDTQTAIGTAGYAPVEQVVGRPRPSSDLYALGATALEMISGLHPLEWKDYATGQVDWKTRIKCTPALEKFLDQMVADIPTRFPSARTAREALQAIRLELSAPAVDVPPSGFNWASTTGDATPSGVKHTGVHFSRGMQIAALGVALAALLTVVFIQQRRQPDSLADSPRAFPPLPPGEASQLSQAVPLPVRDSADVLTQKADDPPHSDKPRSLSSGETTPPDNAGAAARSTRRTDPRTDTMRLECTRLLERISLGEVLSTTESARLSRYCKR